MTGFSGQFQYLAGTNVTQQGSCRVEFDAQTFTLTPDSGTPIVCDLGDIDAVSSADWQIRLPLYTGSVIVLRQFGKAFETLSHDLLEAHRKRMLQCLLLEDMEEIARFNANFTVGSGTPAATPAAGAAEIRLYKTNLAVLPMASLGFQWRLADVDAVRFDAANYEAVLQATPDVLKISKLAKRSEEFVAKVKDALGGLAAASAQALHLAFPFLNPDQLQSAAAVLREGQSAPVLKLAAISARFPDALAANAVDKDLKPYYDYLLARTAKDSLYAGFKLIRKEAQADQADSPEGADHQEGDADGDAVEDTAAAGDSAPDADAASPAALYWFFFPLAAKPGSAEPANVVAWEASSRSGRATYFFRLLDDAQAGVLNDAAAAPAALATGIRRLSRVLALLNFRRRPIYLSDEELERDPRFHRYAIAARRIPEVRAARASFLGRAAHSSVEAWQGQVKKILAKAGLDT